MHSKARFYVKKLGLKKHPEGGYYKEVYRSGEKILSDHLPRRYKSKRNFSTSIYFLLDGKQCSAFHKLKSDEIWHYYDGSDVIVYVINKNGILSIKKLGKTKIAEFQIVIEKHSWFAAEINNKNSFHFLVVRFPLHLSLKILSLVEGKSCLGNTHSIRK